MRTDPEELIPSLVDDYQARLYDAYGSRGRGPVVAFDPAHAERRARYLTRVLRGWLPEDREAPIADLACGTGEVLHFLQGAGYTSLAGVDVSGEQVAVARQVVPSVVEADVFEFLGRHDQHFALLTALDAIEHLRKEEVLPFLDACHRALRPGGRLILQTLNGDSPLVGTVRYGDPTHEACFTPSSLGWLLNLAGFSGLESREAGPRALGLVSLGRCLVWRCLRLGIRLWNLAETGGAGSGVYTRVFLITGTKS